MKSGLKLQAVFELEKRTSRGTKQLPLSVGRVVLWKKVTRLATRPDGGQHRDQGRCMAGLQISA